MLVEVIWTYPFLNNGTHLRMYIQNIEHINIYSTALYVRIISFILNFEFFKIIFSMLFGTLLFFLQQFCNLKKGT